MKRQYPFTHSPYHIGILIGIGLVFVLPPEMLKAQVCTSSGAEYSWPASNPVWTFTWIPARSSSGLDGSGIELRDVKYKGQDVLKVGHAPVLNVEYAPGGCGCFRDWQDNERDFQADNEINACQTQSTPGTVMTVCDAGTGTDLGSFSGTAFEDFGDRLVLTSQSSAGWYRYNTTWTFYLDGRLEPGFGHGTLSSGCVASARNHHIYWRLDFDIDGDDNDFVVESSTVAADQIITTETMRTWGAAGNPNGVEWTVMDAVSNRGYKLTPGSVDVQLPVDIFSKFDALVARYNVGEIDDGSIGCAINPNSFLNDEDVEQEDVVLWYRGSYHNTGGDVTYCQKLGPTLTPVGDWNQNAYAEIKVFLGGAYVGAGAMSTALKAGGHLPLSQPYNTAPWNYAGTETLATIPDGMVDWLLLDFRTGTDEATSVGKQAVLLMSDGSLRSVDGGEKVRLGVPNNAYYLVIEHRNHLPAMSANPINITGGFAFFDFTTAAGQAYGTEPMMEMGDGVFALWPGDATSDHEVKYIGEGRDQAEIVTLLTIGNLSGEVQGYHDADMNLDGFVRYIGSTRDQLQTILSVGISTLSEVRSTDVP